MSTKHGVIGLSVLMGFILGACSGQSDKYVGKWQDVGFPSASLEIVKGNNDGYIIKYHDNRNKRDDEFTATMNNNILHTSMPYVGDVPLIIDNDGLHFSTGQGCKDCSLYKKI